MTHERLTPQDAVPYPVNRTNMAENSGETEDNQLPENPVEGQGRPPRRQERRGSRRREEEDAIQASIDRFDDENIPYELSPEEQRQRIAEDEARRRAIEDVERELAAESAESILTPDAQKLLESFSSGNPIFVPDKVFRDNGISEEDINTKTYNQLVEMLSDMAERGAAETGDFGQSNEQQPGEPQPPDENREGNTQVGEVGGDEPPGQEPPVPPDVPGGPTGPDGPPPDGITNSAKAYIENSNRGYYGPRKNRNFREILLENGFSEKEIENETAQTLFDRLSENGRGQIRPVEIVRGQSSRDTQFPEEPPASSPSNWDEDEQINRLRETLRKLGKSEDEIDEQIALVEQERIQEKIDNAARRGKTPEEIINYIKDDLTPSQFKRFVRNVIERRIEALGAETSIDRLSGSSELLSEYKDKLDEVEERENVTKEDYANLLNDFMQEGVAYWSAKETFTGEEETEQEILASRLNMGEMTNEQESTISPSLFNDFKLLSGLGRDPESTNANLIALRNSDWVRTVIDTAATSRKEQERFRSRWQEILSNPNMTFVRDQGQAFLEDMSRKLSEEIANEDINSIQGLFRYIAQTQNSELYGEGGRYELIDNAGNIHLENFPMWERDISVKKHLDNTNDEMSPLSAVAINTRLGPRNLYLMTREDRERYFKDEKTGRVYHELADMMMTTAWAFGVWRNGSLGYTRIMHNDSKLPEAVDAIHIRNDLTRGDTLATVYSLAEVFGKDTKVGDAIMLANDIYYNIEDTEELKDIIGESLFTREDFIDALKILQKKKDWAMEVKDLTPEEQANLHGSEILDDYKGHYEANPIFDEIADKAGFDQHFFVVEDLADGGTRKHYLFHKDGRLNESAYKRLNFYVTPTEKLSTIALFRELVKVKMNQKHKLGFGIIGKGKSNEIDRQHLMAREEWSAIMEKDGEDEAEREYMKRRTADRINVEYAEIISFSQQRPYGIGAKNDTARRGHDAASKLYMRDYFMRQSGERTAGPIGVPEQLGVIRAATVDFWIGLKTESGKSPMELFKEVRALNNRTDISEDERTRLRADIMAQLRFRDNAEQDLSSNSWLRAFQLFEGQGGGKKIADFSKVVTHTMFGPKYEPEEFEKWKDEFIKPLRYAFSSNAGLKYAQKVRFYDNGEYRDGRLADMMFSQEVLSDIQHQVRQIDAQKRNDYEEAIKKGDTTKAEQIINDWEAFVNGRDLDDPDQLEDLAYEYMDTSNGRIRNVKNVARTLIAANLRFHRKLRSVGEHWDYSRVELLMRALETIEAYEVDPNNPNQLIPNPNRRFFTKEDIAWIRKHSGTEVWRMILIDGGTEASKGLGKGFWDALKILAGNTFQDLAA